MIEKVLGLKSHLSLAVLVLLLSGGCESGDSDSEQSPSAETAQATAGDGELKSAAAMDADLAAKEDGSTAKPDADLKTTAEASAVTKEEAQRPVEPDLNDPRFHAIIKAVADEYLGYGLVNTQVNEVAVPKVAPELCRTALPVIEAEPEPRLSGADSDAAHGKKLYFLFAKDIAHYTNRDGSDSPVGQALVKEAWSSKTGNPNARNLRTHASAVRISPRVKVGDQMLEIGQRTDLFVMVKQAVDADGTDEGWVYGVIDADSRQVKSAGEVASCIACHEGQADRLFRDGIPDWDARAKELIAEPNSASDAKPQTGGDAKPQTGGAKESSSEPNADK